MKIQLLFSIQSVSLNVLMVFTVFLVFVKLVPLNVLFVLLKKFVNLVLFLSFWILLSSVFLNVGKAFILTLCLLLV